MTFWQDYLSVQFDPAHCLSELVFSIIFELLQIVIVAVIVRKRCHPKFDAEHGLTHILREANDGEAVRQEARVPR